VELLTVFWAHGISFAINSNPHKIVSKSGGVLRFQRQKTPTRNRLVRFKLPNLRSTPKVLTPLSRFLITSKICLASLQQKKVDVKVHQGRPFVAYPCARDVKQLIPVIGPGTGNDHRWVSLSDAAKRVAIPKQTIFNWNMQYLEALATRDKNTVAGSSTSRMSEGDLAQVLKDKRAGNGRKLKGAVIDAAHLVPL
jgi:hypothetical protein